MKVNGREPIVKIRDVYEAVPEYGKSHVKVEQLKNFIIKNCQPYLKELGKLTDDNLVLYRGLKSSSKSAFVSSIRKDRRPKDTTLDLHNWMNAAMTKAGFAANRGNSIFCSNSKDMADGYATSFKVGASNNIGRKTEGVRSTYAVYPIGKFAYAYSENIQDFYSDILEAGGLSDLYREGYLDIEDYEEIIHLNHSKSYYMEELVTSKTEYAKKYIQKNGPFDTSKEISIPLIDFVGCITNVGRGSDYDSVRSELIGRFGPMFIDDFDIKTNPRNLELYAGMNYKDKGLRYFLLEGNDNEVMITGDKVLYVRHDYNDLLLPELAK